MIGQPLSSGRWDMGSNPNTDSIGTFQNAVDQEHHKAFVWANTRTLKELHWAITVMASDTNAFTLYERKALLEVVALRLASLYNDANLGRELQEELGWQNQPGELQ